MSFLFNLNTKIHTETETKPVMNAINILKRDMAKVFGASDENGNELEDINNKELKGFSEEDILSAGLAAYDVELGEDEYFVMGDNCNNSEDSRVSNIGNIKRSQFVGKIAGTLHKVTRQ